MESSVWWNLNQAVNTQKGDSMRTHCPGAVAQPHMGVCGDMWRLLSPFLLGEHTLLSLGLLVRDHKPRRNPINNLEIIITKGNENPAVKNPDHTTSRQSHATDVTCFRDKSTRNRNVLNMTEVSMKNPQLTSHLTVTNKAFPKIKNKTRVPPSHTAEGLA